jgi:RHS repeat-associated protein
MTKFRKSIACLTVVTLLFSGIGVPAVHAETAPPPAPTGNWKPQSKRGFWDRLLGRHVVPSQGEMRPGREWSPARLSSQRTALTLTSGTPAVQLDEPRTVHATGARLSWSAYADPSSASEDDLVEYQVHRSAQPDFAASAATLVAPLPEETTSYTDTTATPDSMQYYQVVVVREDGQRPASEVLAVETPPAEDALAATKTPQRMYAGETVTVPVTVTNTTAQTWPAASTRLGYGWRRPDGANATAAGGVLLTPLPADLAPGQTVTVGAPVRAPALSGGSNKAEAYTLVWDLIDTTTDQWLSAAGTVPQLEQQIGIESPTSNLLGLEDFYSYSGVPTGGAGGAMVNNYAGNVAWSYDAFTNPSRGPDASVVMTYNSLDTSRSSMGFGWSLRAATLQRLGSRLTFSPPGQTWPAQVRLIDNDGTTSVFTLDPHGRDVKDCGPTTCDYVHPRGVHLYLQRSGSADPTRTWVFTAPDRTRFFFDAEGYQSAIVDGNNNAMSFVYEQRRSGNVPTKFLRRVEDAHGRPTLTLDWWAKGENYTYITDTGAEASATSLTNPFIIDQLQSITDVAGRKITFTYTVQGLMAKMVDGAGDPKAKTFRFGYDMTQGNNNAKLLTVTDPRGNDTKFDYYYPQVGDDPRFHWRAKTVTDRLGGVTSFGYVDPDGPTGATLHTTVTDPEANMTRYVLDAFGRPVRITDAKHQTTLQDFDADHNLVRLEEPPANPRDADGGVSTWTYDTVTGYPTSFKTARANQNGWRATTYDYATTHNGHVADLLHKTSPEGRRWTFLHDAAGNLLSMTDPAGTASPDPVDYTTMFGYDGVGQLVRMVDANGHATTFSGHDATGQPTTIINADGKATRVEYDDRGNQLSVTDPLQHSRFRDYDLFKRPLESAEHKDAAAGDLIITPAPVYDGNDNVTRSTLANGAVYTSAYDANDRVTSVLEPRDDDGPERKTSFTYDKVGNQRTVTEPNGNLTDAPGDYTTTYGYDEIYQQVTATDAAGHTTRYRYDGAGNLATVVDGHKNVTTEDDYTAIFSYTLDHQISSIFDAAGFHTDFGYDRDGLRTTVTDQNGSVSTTAYDPRGLVTETRVPHEIVDGEVKPAVTRFEYDQVGNQTKVISPRGVLTEDPTDFLTETKYDALNRPFEIIYPFDRDDPDPRYQQRHSVVYIYDDASRLTEIQLPALERQFNSNPDPDKAGRIISKLDYFDNDRIKKSTDPFGVATGYEYDELGQPTKRTITAPDGAEQRFLRWEYQPDGKVKHLTDDGGTSDPPEFTAFDYAYDATGNLTTLEDRTADATIDLWDLDYDQRNQVEKVTESLAGDVKNITTYGYDENGALRHRLHDRGTDEFSYDVRNLPATVRNISGETQHETSIEYTPRGERRKETKSNGNVVTYDYFLDGLLKHSVEESRDHTVQAEHTLEYQPNLHISRDVAKLRCAPTGDPPGECSIPEVTRTYTYDPRDRVVRVDNAGHPQSNEFYAYDANSNVIVQDVDDANRIFRYDRNRLTDSGTAAGVDANYEYDPSGRLLVATTGEGENKKVTASYAYDAFDHVTATAQGGFDAVVHRTNNYTYDPFGRTSSNIATVGDARKQTVFNYLGMSGEVLDEEVPDGQGNDSVTQWFEYSADDERLGMTKIVGGAPEHSVYGYNSHGDVETLTDASGNTRGTYGYSAYGALVDVNTTGVDAPDRQNPFKESYNPYWYNSKRFDKIGSTYEIGARGYQPDIHRFLTPETGGDALGDAGLGLNPGTSNRYGFAGGNPIANPRYSPNTPFDWKKEFARLGAALAVGIGVTALAALCPASWGIGCVAGAWLIGGAAAGAAGYGAGVAVDPNQSFNWADFGIETGVGAAAGLLTFGAGRLLGAESRLFTGTIRYRGTRGIPNVPYRVSNSLSPKTLGETDMLGNITVRPQSRQSLIETLRHESVHRLLSPRHGPFRQARAEFNQKYRYNRSDLWRFLEEAAAETYGTGSLRRGVRLAYQEYGVTPRRLVLESAVVVGTLGGVGAAGYGLYEWASS